MNQISNLRDFSRENLSGFVLLGLKAFNGPDNGCERQ
jgi:hypothetical protein